MTCVAPQKGFYARDGSGQFTKSRKRAYIDRPLVVSCGQCIGCRTERRRVWSLRLLHENSLHDYSMFITLTYSDAYLPVDGSLSKRDLQLFIKRYRKSVSPVTIRYFAVGEYGGETYRPHYHIILFGYLEPSLMRATYSDYGSSQLFLSPVLDRIWGKGQVVVADVNEQSINYVAGYVVDKLSNNDNFKRCIVDTGEYVDVQPTFNLMSRRPGIGYEWYSKFSSDVFPDDFCVQSGRKTAVPRYYYRKLKEQDENLASKVSRGRIIRGILRAQERTPERLLVKETIYKSRLKKRGNL